MMNWYQIQICQLYHVGCIVAMTCNGL